MSVSDDGRFDLLVDDGEKGLRATGESAGDDQSEVVWDVVFRVIRPD